MFTVVEQRAAEKRFVVGKSTSLTEARLIMAEGAGRVVQNSEGQQVYPVPSEITSQLVADKVITPAQALLIVH